MSSVKRAWNEMVQRIEEEIAENGPGAVDNRKLQFLMAAYVRDIRDELAKAAAFRPIQQVPARGSSWDVDEGAQEEGGDTRPFQFIDELRVPRPREAAIDDGKKDKTPKKK